MATRPITDTLRLLQGGMLLDRASDELAALVKGVDDTGKPGQLTITLKLKKASGAIEIVADVKTKVPEQKPDSDLLWATVEGNLSVDNPSQRKLDLRVAETKKVEVRTVDQDTGEIRQAS